MSDLHMQQKSYNANKLDTSRQSSLSRVPRKWCHVIEASLIAVPNSRAGVHQAILVVIVVIVMIMIIFVINLYR